MQKAVVAFLVFVSLSPVAAQTPKGAKSDDSIAARLKVFEDKAEIEGVLLDYGRYLDSRDFAGYSSLFAKDGEWVGGFGSVTGPANIKTFMSIVERTIGSSPSASALANERSIFS